MRFQVIGMKGGAGFDDIVAHFQSLGGDCVLMDPDMVVGKDHILSAATHGERSMAEGTNRSNSLLTEIILYAAWERQIGKALARMRPKEGRTEYAALLVDVDDPELEAIGMERDDSLLDPTPEKAAALGLSDPFLGPVEQALERVALLETQKM
ncbi:MAG: KEOPS complex subunit Cgi121 [Thermoplasmata archaeon]|nr:KEOPS complex subunit Cgi121 [Thermoplasmata archaeon]